MSVVDRYFSGLPEEWKIGARQREEMNMGLNDQQMVQMLINDRVNPIPHDPLGAYDTISRYHDPDVMEEIGRFSPHDLVVAVLNNASLEDVGELLEKSGSTLADALTEAYGQDARDDGTVGIAIEILRDLFLSDHMDPYERLAALERINLHLGSQGIPTPAIPEFVADEDVINRAHVVQSEVMNVLDKHKGRPTPITIPIPIDDEKEEEKATTPPPKGPPTEPPKRDSKPKVKRGRKRGRPNLDVGFAMQILDRYASEDMFTRLELDRINVFRELVARGASVPKRRKTDLRNSLRDVIERNNPELRRRVESEQINDVRQAEDFLKVVKGKSADPRLPKGRQRDLEQVQSEIRRMAKSYLSGNIRRSLVHSGVMAQTGMSGDELKQLQTALDSSTENLDIDKALVAVGALPRSVKDKIPNYRDVADEIAQRHAEMKTAEAQLKTSRDAWNAAEEKEIDPADPIWGRRENEMRLARENIIQNKTFITGLLYQLGPDVRHIIDQNIRSGIVQGVQDFNAFRQELDDEIPKMNPTVRAEAIKIRDRLGTNITVGQAKEQLKQFSSRAAEPVRRVINHKRLLDELQEALDRHAAGRRPDPALERKHTFRRMQAYANQHGFQISRGDNTRNNWRQQMYDKLKLQQNTKVSQAIMELPQFAEFNLDDKIDEDFKRLVQDKPHEVGPGWVKARFSKRELPLGNRYGKIKVYKIEHGHVIEIDPSEMVPGELYYIETQSESMKIEILRHMERSAVDKLRMPNDQYAIEDLRDSRNRPMNEDELHSVGGSLSFVPTHEPHEPIREYDQFHGIVAGDEDPFTNWMAKYSRQMAKRLPTPPEMGAIKHNIDEALLAIRRARPYEPNRIKRHFQEPAFRQVQFPVLQRLGLQDEVNAHSHIAHGVIRGAHHLGGGWQEAADGVNDVMKVILGAGMSGAGIPGNVQLGMVHPNFGGSIYGDLFQQTGQDWNDFSGGGFAEDMKRAGAASLRDPFGYKELLGINKGGGMAGAGLEGEGLFDDIGDAFKSAGNAVASGVSSAANKVAKGASDLATHVGNSVIHEGQKVIDAEKRHWSGTAKRISDIVEKDAVPLTQHFSLENVGKFGRSIIDVGREELDAVQNDPLMGVPVTLAASTMLPELGMVKSGLDVISMASHGDFDGSFTAAMSALAEKEAGQIPGYSQYKTIEDTIDAAENSKKMIEN